MSSLSHGSGELHVLFPFVSAEKPVRALREYRVFLAPDLYTDCYTYTACNALIHAHMHTL